MIKKYRRIIGSKNGQEYIETLHEEELKHLTSFLNENERNELIKIVRRIKVATIEKKREEEALKNIYEGCSSCANCKVNIDFENDSVSRMCILNAPVDISLRRCPIDRFAVKIVTSSALVEPVVKTYFQTQQ